MRKFLAAAKGLLSRIQYNSPVILTYALVCFAVLLLNMATADWTLYHLFSVYKSSLTDPLTYVRLVGHTVGHGGFNHYFSNILLVLMIGPILEEKYGSKNILRMILITGVITGLAHMLLFNTVLTGASGVVFMLIILSSYANFKSGRVPLTLIVCVAVFIGREVSNIITKDTNISYFTHVLGGLCGAGFGFAIHRKSASGGTKEPTSLRIDQSSIKVDPASHDAATVSHNTESKEPVIDLTDGK